jgi:hypothetical protein
VPCFDAAMGKFRTPYRGVSLKPALIACALFIVCFWLLVHGNKKRIAFQRCERWTREQRNAAAAAQVGGGVSIGVFYPD